MNISYIELEFTHSILAIAVFVIASIVFVFGGAWIFENPSLRNKAVLPVIILSVLGAGFGHYLVLENRDSNSERTEAVIAQQNNQISDTYGLEAFDTSSNTPLCSKDNANKPHRLNATWNSDYGTIVVGARRGDFCEVSVFEKNGRKLEPVK